MNILTKHLNQNCDPRLPGVLTFSVKEAYRYLHQIVKDNPILQQKESKKSYGHLRNSFVDIALQRVLENSSINHKIAPKSTSTYKNGYTYLMIEVEGESLLLQRQEQMFLFLKKQHLEKEEVC